MEGRQRGEQRRKEAKLVDTWRTTVGRKKEERSAGYGDAKVANREIRVWHGATENGP